MKRNEGVGEGGFFLCSCWQDVPEAMEYVGGVAAGNGGEDWQA